MAVLMLTMLAVMMVPLLELLMMMTMARIYITTTRMMMMMMTMVPSIAVVAFQLRYGAGDRDERHFLILYTNSWYIHHRSRRMKLIVLRRFEAKIHKDTRLNY